MKANELIEQSLRLLREKRANDPGLVERASALLARQAVEQCSDEILSKYGLDASAVSFTSQLLCLQGVMADKELARDIAAVWGTLSSVVHYDTVELAPTETELLELVQRAQALVQRMQFRGTAGSGGGGE